jgi:UDP-N-acetylmuramoyl-tripeptide--D-alanyl-D-alanine ligase
MASCYRRSVIPNTRLIAVVGSLGKTTTTRAIAKVLGGRRVGPRLRSNQFGFLAVNLLAIRPGQPFAVIEAGISAPGQMSRYATMLLPDVTVVTSIATEHITSLGTLANTANEKAEMVRVLEKGALCVLNGDDPLVRQMGTTTRARVVTCGFVEHSDVRVLEARLRWPHGTDLVVAIGGRKWNVRTRLFGRPMIYPVLFALAVAWDAGLDLDDAVTRLEGLRATPGRLQAIRLPGDAIILRDEFKASLESMDAALEFLSEIPASRRIAVLGDVTEISGSQGPVYRRLGAMAAAACQRIILVGHSEKRYASGIRQSGRLPPEAVLKCKGSHERAVSALQQEMRPGDVILVKGRLSQRLERIALALCGTAPTCKLKECQATNLYCSDCNLLSVREMKPTAARRQIALEGGEGQVGDYWEKIGSDWLNRVPAGGLWRRYNDETVGALVVRWLGKRVVTRLLKTDIFEEATGRGLSPLLADHARLLFATDVSMPLIRAASSRYPELRLVQCDIREPAFPANTFNVIISPSTLDHFATATELRKALNRLASLLAPSGELIITLDNLSNPVIALRNAVPHRWRTRLGLTPYYVGATCGPVRLRKYLEEAGLKVVELTAVVHVPRWPAIGLASLLEKYCSSRASERLLPVMQMFEALSGTRYRYLTGNFVAALALKPGKNVSGMTDIFDVGLVTRGA